MKTAHRRRRKTATGRFPGGSGILAPIVIPACALIWTLAAGQAAASIEEAQRLMRELQFDEARSMLEDEVDRTRGDRRAEALFLLAGCADDHRMARRHLLEARRAAESAAWQERVDLELAQLDYARGNYNSVRTRLRNTDTHAARLLKAQALVATERYEQALETLGNLPDDEAALLRGWSLKKSGRHGEAVGVLQRLSEANVSDHMPAILLWKAQSQLELGRRDDALATANQLQSRFPTAPEAAQIEPTLARLRSPQNIESHAAGFHLQLGAFGDRANALRFRDGLPRELGSVSITEIRQEGRRLYRVQLGPYASREVAEAYARTQLAPLDIDWQVLLPEEE